MTKQPDPSAEKALTTTTKSIVDRWYEARLERETKEQFERELEEYLDTVRAKARTALVDEVLGEVDANAVHGSSCIDSECEDENHGYEYIELEDLRSLLLKKRGEDE